MSRCPNCGYDPADSVCSPTLLHPGSIILNKYIVGGVIGMGGFGITYLAFDKAEDRRVAIKEYFPRDTAHRESDSAEITVDDCETFDSGAEKFYSEAEIVSSLRDNPNIVKIYDTIRANNTIYLVMEFLRGKTIREYLCDHGMFDASGAVYIARGVLNALSSAHKSNVLHRDISPDNIIICGNGDVKLIDFGAARRVIEECTQNFSAIVKYGFAPPEQYRKKTDQGAWSDIYSLGATIYYSLTGDIPADPMLRYDIDDTFGENNFGIDEELWDIIVKATRLDSKERYQNVEEMSAALDAITIEPKVVTFSDTELFRPIFKSQSPRGSSFSAVGAQRGSAKASPAPRKKRGIIIALASVAAAAAITIPIAVNSLGRAEPDVYSDSSDDTSSNAASSEPISDTEPISTAEPISDPASIPDAKPVPLTETFPYFGEYESKIWYINLPQNEKEIYKIILEGMENGDLEIYFPPDRYKYSEVEKSFNSCLFDNPWLYNIGTFSAYIHDEKETKTTDPDKYIYYIKPEYINRYATVNMDVDLLRKEIKDITQYLTKDSYGLFRIESELQVRTSVVARYSGYTSASAYGSLVYEVADDVGAAKGFCICAQAIGFPCRVIDGTKNGQPRAWCAVKMDDTWYNVDIYGDMFVQNEIDKTIPANRDAYYTTYFLASDAFFKQLGYEPTDGWESLGGEEFAANSPYKNYYHQYCVLENEEYFAEDAQSVYERLLEMIAATRWGKVEVKVAPFLVNELNKLIKENLVSDLSEKYGITISGYEVYYEFEKFKIEFTKQQN